MHFLGVTCRITAAAPSADSVTNAPPASCPVEPSIPEVTDRPSPCCSSQLQEMQLHRFLLPPPPPPPPLNRNTQQTHTHTPPPAACPQSRLRPRDIALVLWQSQPRFCPLDTACGDGLGHWDASGLERKQPFPTQRHFQRFEGGLAGALLSEIITFLCLRFLAGTRNVRV